MTRLRLSEDSSDPQIKIPNGISDNSELQAILTETVDQEVCLLRDSPFRILRVSFFFYYHRIYYANVPVTTTVQKFV